MKARKEYDCNNVARCLSPDCGKTLCEMNDCHAVRVISESDYRKIMAVVRAAKAEMTIVSWRLNILEALDKLDKAKGGNNERH